MWTFAPQLSIFYYYFLFISAQKVKSYFSVLLNAEQWTRAYHKAEYFSFFCPLWNLSWLVHGTINNENVLVWLFHVSLKASKLISNFSFPEFRLAPIRLSLEVRNAIMFERGILVSSTCSENYTYSKFCELIAVKTETPFLYFSLSGI